MRDFWFLSGRISSFGKAHWEHWIIDQTTLALSTPFKKNRQAETTLVSKQNSSTAALNTTGLPVLSQQDSERTALAHTDLSL